jgi:hypothetical protein
MRYTNPFSFISISSSCRLTFPLMSFFLFSLGRKGIFYSWIRSLSQSRVRNVGLTPTGANRSMVVGPHRAALEKEEGAGGTDAKVHRDLPLRMPRFTVTLPQIRSLRRSSGGKTPHRAATTPESLVYTRSGSSSSTPSRSTTTSPTRTSTSAPMMSSPTDKPSGETH